MRSPSSAASSRALLPGSFALGMIFAALLFSVFVNVQTIQSPQESERVARRDLVRNDTTTTAALPVRETKSLDNSVGNKNSTLEVILNDKGARLSALPDRVFTVVGLESSGTTFVASVLQHALGLNNIRLHAQNGETIGQGLSKNFLDRNQYYTEVQHVSLPWGARCTGVPTAYKTFLPVIYPGACSRFARERASRSDFPPPYDPVWLFHNSGIIKQFFQQSRIKTDHERVRLWNDCQRLMEPQHDGKPYAYPRRYILNITSNLEWYTERGVDAKTVIVMRERNIAARARTMDHCNNNTLLELEEQSGMLSIQQAAQAHNLHTSTSNHGLLDVSADGKVILVSYEMMIHLQEDFLQALYQALGIASDYFPVFRDGNGKHVLPRPQL